SNLWLKEQGRNYADFHCSTGLNIERNQLVLTKVKLQCDSEPMIKTPEEIIPTRRSLLTRLKQWDDHESWKDFFDTYWKLVYGVAVKSGLNENEAQEVVQETVIAVAKKMHDFKYDPAVGSFKSWPATQVRETLGISATQVYLAKLRISKLVKKEVKKLEAEML